MTSISLRNVSIDVPIYGVSGRNAKGSIMRRVRGHFDTETVWIRALDDITLDLAEGSRLGLLGANGAGKTTLLRVLAGILSPTAGEIAIDGSVAAMFDLGLGMSDDESGVANAMMRGLLLGHTRRQMNELLPSIIDFAGIGERINHPMRTYSAGMRARVSFSISTAINAEILLIDEGIGMADAAFTEKASQRLNAFMERAGLLVLASHSDQLLRQFCDTGLVLDKGRMAFMGPIDDAVAFYNSSVSAP